MQSKTKIFATAQDKNVSTFVPRKICWKWPWLSVLVDNFTVSSVYNNPMNLPLAEMSKDGAIFLTHKKETPVGSKIIQGNVLNVANQYRRKLVVPIWSACVSVNFVINAINLGINLTERWSTNVLTEKS